MTDHAMLQLRPDDDQPVVRFTGSCGSASQPAVPSPGEAAERRDDWDDYLGRVDTDQDLATAALKAEQIAQSEPVPHCA